MEEETVILPKPSDEYEYKLVRKRDTGTSKVRLRDKDPSELTPKQLSALKYREKNREKINEKKRTSYHENKKKENQ